MGGELHFHNSTIHSESLFTTRHLHAVILTQAIEWLLSERVYKAPLTLPFVVVGCSVEYQTATRFYHYALPTIRQLQTKHLEELFISNCKVMLIPAEPYLLLNFFGSEFQDLTSQY
jgi:hypothetical protein